VLIVMRNILSIGIVTR